MRRAPFVVAVLLAVGTVAGPHVSGQTVATSPSQHETLAQKIAKKFRRQKPPNLAKTISDEARLAAIRKAQLWLPTDIPSMNLRAGPQGPGSFAPGAVVPCHYVERELTGTSPKFDCDVGEGDVVKVRYGEANGKVEGEVLATRLLWALGFGADAVYPVRVECRDCPPDPWKDRAAIPDAEHTFEPAAIERKLKGRELQTATQEGWSWPELDLVDETQGGAPKAQRDALKLLAVLIQHTDTKPDQQRLLCRSDSKDEQPCEAPLMMLHDVGTTFGHANYFNKGAVGSVNFGAWSKTPIWRDAAICQGHLSRSATGTLGDHPIISEAGRQFLADLLVQLTDAQLHDLFDVAGVERRDPHATHERTPGSVDQWVAAFQRKRADIVNTRCPA